MKKILFWSPLHGQGQTSNLHIISFILNILYKKKVLLMQTHFTLNNLESPLVGKNVDKQKELENKIFQDIGIDAAAMYSQMDLLDKEILESCCLTFNNLLLMPGTKIRNIETFKREIGKEIINLIETANKYVDIVMIDTNSGEDELSFKIMNISDLIVINLTQKRYVIETFFEKYGDKFKENEKVFFLFGDYDKNSIYNINNCRRKFGKYIKKENSGVIPYCTDFLDNTNEGKLQSFMEKGLKKNQENKLQNIINELQKKEETEKFFSESKLAAKKILKMLNL